MVDTQKIDIERTRKSRRGEMEGKELPFGKVFADHMFRADFRDGEWKDFRILPYGHISVSPATPAVHYGQSIFEGLKAHRGPGGDVLVFRPLANLKRMNASAERMCMPAIPEELFMEGIAGLLELDRDWVPRTEGSSFYIRPFLFSADEYIGIRPSQAFTFMIINCPVGPYYAAPVKVKIETQYSRSIEGGTGHAKAGGNYGGAIYPSALAQKEGYHQLIWTDGKTHEYVEESGTMNLMFVINGTLVTPPLSDTILHGITRDSVLTLARRLGIPSEERPVSVRELIKGLSDGSVQEAFGVGTAAAIAPIELIGHNGNDYRLPDTRQISDKIFLELDGIKRGAKPDPFGWTYKM
jgi:branched-chain amino acid aminotransferase